jgi:hypothetical protein
MGVASTRSKNSIGESPFFTFLLLDPPTDDDDDDDDDDDNLDPCSPTVGRNRPGDFKGCK